MKTFTALFPFCGLGAGALGFLEAVGQLGADRGRFRNLGGIDNDADACADFETLTGTPALCADLAKLTPDELRRYAGNQVPDCVFSSPPCKGFSRLMGTARAATPKYQALNELVFQGLFLVCETWSKPPPLIVVENVPGITSRGAGVLIKVRQLLGQYGYVFHEGTHDCGEVGGLAQHRRRFLLVARRPVDVPAFVYQPPKQRVKACGEVLADLPVPGQGDEGGPLHQLPKLSWLNWVRLALIPAGGDWRDLPEAVSLDSGASAAAFGGRPGLFGVVDASKPIGAITGKMVAAGGSTPGSVADPRLFTPLEPGQARREVFAKYDVRGWENVARTVAGSGTNGGFGVADPRATFHHAHRVTPWEGPVGTVTSSPAPSSGGGAVADPRLGKQSWRGAFGVGDWAEPMKTIRGAGEVRQAPSAVADPRLQRHQAKYRIERFDAPAHTITGTDRLGSGAANVADPRVRFSNKYKLHPFDEPVGCITGDSDIQTGSRSVADPRVRSARNGFYGVISWEDAAATVTGSAQIDNGRWALADPRKAGAEGLPLIVSADGTWHRPITTLEMAGLQSIPTTLKGKPLQLAGRRISGWRERIGNAVPGKAAAAIARSVLKALIAASTGGWYLSSDEIWVRKRDGWADEAAEVAP